MGIKAHIPNLFTLGNLLCGCLSIGMVFHLPGTVAYPLVAALMILAFIFDWLDGLVARLLGVSSRFGKELDSMADMVTFGVLPGLLAARSIQSMVDPASGTAQEGLGAMNTFFTSGMVEGSALWLFLPFIGFLIPCFAAIRLAAFNLDLRQSFHFRGLPAPANGIIFLAIYMWVHQHIDQLPQLPYFLADGVTPNPDFIDYGMIPAFPRMALILSGLVVLFSILMVTRIPLMALKFRDFSFAHNWHKFSFILISTGVALWLGYRSAPIILGLYFLFSVVDYYLSKQETHRAIA